RLNLSDDRVADRMSKNTGFKMLFRNLKSFRGFTYVDRNDRRLAALKLESAFLQFALEEFRVGPEYLDQLFAFGQSQQRKRRLACPHRRRRVRGRKQKWPSAQIEKIDQVARAAYVA